MRWLLTDAGWSAVEVEDSCTGCTLQAGCTVHGESDVDAPGFYWAADDSRDPYWWSGYGFRMAGTFATLGANGLHIHQLSPQTPAQMRRLRAEWAQAARVDADASMSRGTAMRAARRAGCGGGGGARRRLRRNCCWAVSEHMRPPQLLLSAEGERQHRLSHVRPRRPLDAPPT